MRLDIELDEKMIEDARRNEVRTSFGHLGTHIDLKGKTFEDTLIRVLICRIEDDTEVNDIDLSSVEEGMFVIFASGHSKRYRYGSREYKDNYSTLSRELIERLIEKKVRLIGTDGPGIRKGSEHPLIDRYLSDRDIFVVENMYIPDTLMEGKVYDVSIIAMDRADDGMRVEIDIDE